MKYDWARFQKFHSFDDFSLKRTYYFNLVVVFVHLKLLMKSCYLSFQKLRNKDKSKNQHTTPNISKW